MGREMRRVHLGIGALLLLSLCLQAHAVLSPCDGGARTAAAGAQAQRAAKSAAAAADPKESSWQTSVPLTTSDSWKSDDAWEPESWGGDTP